eukprot:572321-Pleurochrysis_carterae.AAC.2
MMCAPGSQHSRACGCGWASTGAADVALQEARRADTSLARCTRQEGGIRLCRAGARAGIMQ